MATIKGGTKLENALARMSARLNKPGTLAVGFLENATYPNGTPVAMVGAIQEYGAPRAGIPPRSYFRTMIAAKSPNWPGGVKNALKASDYDATHALQIVGMAIRGQLQQSILDTNAPPLSPVTLMLRKMKSQNQSLVVTRRTVNEARRRVAAGESYAGVATKPLVETSHMINSVDFEVT